MKSPPDPPPAPPDPPWPNSAPSVSVHRLLMLLALALSAACDWSHGLLTVLSVQLIRQRLSGEVRPAPTPNESRNNVRLQAGWGPGLGRKPPATVAQCNVNAAFHGDVLYLKAVDIVAVILNVKVLATA